MKKKKDEKSIREQKPSSETNMQKQFSIFLKKAMLLQHFRYKLSFHDP